MLYLWFLRFYGWLPKPIRYRAVRLFKPSYTVGTIPFVVRSDGRVLLVRHSYKQRWATPGGFVNRNESPQDAAVREAREEVGLGVRTVGEPMVVVDAHTQRVEIVVIAELLPGVDPDTARAASVEIVEVAWFDLDDLPDLQEETMAAWSAIERSGRLSLP